MFNKLGLKRGDIVAVIGGREPLVQMAHIAQTAKVAGWRVLVTTTGMFSQSFLAVFPAVHAQTDDLADINDSLARHHIAFVYRTLEQENGIGVAPLWAAWARQHVQADLILIEAGGVRNAFLPNETNVLLIAAEADAPLTLPVIDQVRAGVRVLTWLNSDDGGRAHHLLQRDTTLSAAAYGEQDLCGVARRVGAVVLAAGLSSRMGQLKVLMDWDGQPVIAAILKALVAGGVASLSVVTGYQPEPVEYAARMATETIEHVPPLSIVHNAAYERGDMLFSIQAGLRALPANVDAALIVLGDQPRIRPDVVEQVLIAYAEGEQGIVLPSYQMRRGHPMLVSRRYWHEILALPEGGTLRDFMRAHTDDIAYVEAPDDSVLHDMDTPDDYQAEKRRAGLA